MKNYDVVVVGAGPAGATLGYLLARSGVKTLLIEQNFDLGRTFRGPGFLPSSLIEFKKLGLFERIEEKSFGRIEDLSVFKSGKPIIQMKLSALGVEPPYGLTLPHPPLLQLLIDEALAYPHFDYIGGYGATRFMMHEGGVSGVLCERNGQTIPLSSKLTVVSDGRYSTLRTAAGIELVRENVSFDVIWLELPLVDGEKAPLTIEAEQGGQAIFIPQDETKALVGFMVAPGSFESLRNEGVDAFRKRAIEEHPAISKSLQAGLREFSQLHNLSVQIGRAKEWARKGLVLIGDAAHISSPVASQGNNLAILDSFHLLPHIISALKRHNGIVTKADLAPYVSYRKPQVVKIQRLQAFIWKFISAKNPVVCWLQSHLGGLMSKSPIGKKVFRRIILGFEDIPDVRQYFTDSETKRYWPLTVKECSPEGKSGVKVRFECSSNIQDLFVHTPGQYLTLRMKIKGNIYQRCYSIFGKPGDLSIVVKRVKNGLVSNEIADNLKPGQTILALPPQGDFCWSSPIGKEKDAFIAGGSGITPILSMMTQIKNEGAALFLVNRSREDAVLVEEVTKLAEVKGIDITWWWTEDKRPTSKDLQAWMSCLNASRVYVCGPEGLMTHAREAAFKFGLNSDRYHQEFFVKKNELESLIRKGLNQQKSVTLERGEAEDASPAVLHVRYGEKQTKGSSNADTTVLDQALSQQGVPHSCLAGLCGQCRAKLVSGRVTLQPSTGSSQEERDQGIFLTCQARPASPKVEIEFSKQEN